ncbi:MAG TPA: phenylalanine--tRNA ligase subunit alpha [Gemmatimonadaceae bacterium]|nr:phenylalanine--tRNA ligase subunit alpha [Gemmatimonadaceae bacterium]
MTLQEYKVRYEQLRQAIDAHLASVTTEEQFRHTRDRVIGRHSGLLRELQAMIPGLAASERAEAGKLFNALHDSVRRQLLAVETALSAAAPAAPALDRTMPARESWRGALHPVSLVLDEICDIFRELGFTVALGPEAETEWYNFGGLNFPADHPAMELHDTLYLEGGGLLRTHTSPVQLRTLQRHPPPIRILAPGNAYRRDFFDATHAPMFAQLEGLAVDEGITFADLKATLTHFVRRFYGTTRRTRLGPSYFPFTEPSAEMHVEVDLGDGKGPRWIEILGCGLVHPAVLESAGVDSERYTGWAFGMGPGRIALSRHGIPDIRLLSESDVRFLGQFAQ